MNTALIGMILILKLYLALLLCVSGLAKIEHSARFGALLRSQLLLPSWLLRLIQTALPGTELIIGFLLVSGIATRLVGSVTVICLLVFLFTRIYLYTKSDQHECGCFGPIRPEKIDGAAVTTSTIWVGIGILHLYLSANWVVPQIANHLSFAFILILCFLITVRMLQRRRWRLKNDVVSYIVTNKENGWISRLNLK